jgi:hypothetical protein
MQERSRADLVLSIMCVLIPLVIFAVHASLVQGWIVDDAAITFAYARNFAQGHGLVSQPGVPPVEGYSNFTWLLLVAPFHALDPVLTTKWISLTVAVAAFFVIVQTLKPLDRLIGLVGLSLVALNTSFVIWSVSGLENPLYVLLICLLLYFAVQPITRRSALLAGLIGALIAMTRPDGLAYLPLFPLFVLIAPRTLTIKERMLCIVLFIVAFIGVYGAFLAFRLAYFGELMPNTYTMKGGPKVEDVIELLTLQPEMVSKLEKFMASVASVWAAPLLLLTTGLTMFVLATRGFTRLHFALLMFGLCALSIYLLLPPDWMGEYRFATPFFLMFYLYLAAITGTALKTLLRPVYRPLFALTGAVALILCFNFFMPRSLAFAQKPTVSMQSVIDRYGIRFDYYAETFDIENASVMLPDVGGMIYASDLRVYDLAGLTDRRVAQTLGRRINRAAFHDYVFEEAQPTFIHTHGFWTIHTKLESDERFREDYVPICEYIDEWVLNNYGKEYHSGDFVRREVVQERPEILNRLRTRLDSDCELKPLEFASQGN